MLQSRILRNMFPCRVTCSRTYSFYSNIHRPTLSALGGALIGGNAEQRRFKRPPFLKKSPATRVVQFDYSGDLLKQAPVSGLKLHYAFTGIQELKQSPDELRRLFTLDFADGTAVKEHREKEIIEHIESKLGKDCDLEKKVAIQTIQIRNEMQHCMAFKKDTRAKARLIERIQRRKKDLKELRSMDHERFVWILTELRIKYVSAPLSHEDKSRRAVRLRAVTTEMLEGKKTKAKQLHEAFQEKRAEFDVYKREVLAGIGTDMEALSLSDEDVVAYIVASIVRPEPNVDTMTRIERALYMQHKAKKEKEWKYEREVS